MVSTETIDHATLTNRLTDWYGISDQAQIWLSSYLKNRHQFLKIKDVFSDKDTLSYGVSQGFTLVSLYFILYTIPLNAVIHSFDICLNHNVDNIKCVGMDDRVQLEV